MIRIKDALKPPKFAGQPDFSFLVSAGGVLTDRELLVLNFGPIFEASNPPRDRLNIRV